MSKFFEIPSSRKTLIFGVAMIMAYSPAQHSIAQEIPPADLIDVNDAADSDLPAAPATNVPDDPEAEMWDLGNSSDFDFEKTPQQLQEEIRSQAFDAALEGLLPLRPEEIRILLERFDRTQESVETPIYPPPKPLSVVETLSMDPGAPPTVIKTAMGNITTLNFIDITGKPWPVENVSWAGDFEVMESEVPEDKGNNIVRITPRNEYARGNMSINMVHLHTPIVVSLTTDKDEVHYRFDATVPEDGPFAEVSIIDRGVTLAAGRADLSGLLQGIVPSSAQKMQISGVDGRTSVYNYNGMTYLRTPHTLLSPGWNNSVASGDGMKVYELQSTPVVLMSDKGKMVRAQISDREELLDE